MNLKISESSFNRKRQIDGLKKDRSLLDDHRNDVIEEVARKIETLESAFGKDTIASFTIFIRSLKE